MTVQRVDSDLSSRQLDQLESWTKGGIMPIIQQNNDYLTKNSYTTNKL